MEKRKYNLDKFRILDLIRGLENTQMEHPERTPEDLKTHLTRQIIEEVDGKKVVVAVEEASFTLKELRELRDKK